MFNWFKDLIPLYGKKMSETQTQSTQTQSTKPKFRRSGRRAGRTLLVKVHNVDNFNRAYFEQFDGIDNVHFAENSSSFFLTFDTTKNALTAYKSIRNNPNNYRVKFAHYKVFFTLDGLDSMVDYSQLKTSHSALVAEKTGGNVLYYKLYRKNGSYVGCGDMTLDTKASFDALVDKEGNYKTLTLDDITAVHYRYNRHTNNTTTSATTSA